LTGLKLSNAVTTVSIPLYAFNPMVATNTRVATTASTAPRYGTAALPVSLIPASASLAPR
jgi:hypothetical protein